MQTHIRATVVLIPHHNRVPANIDPNLVRNLFAREQRENRLPSEKRIRKHRVKVREERVPVETSHVERRQADAIAILQQMRVNFIPSTIDASQVASEQPNENVLPSTVLTTNSYDRTDEEQGHSSDIGHAGSSTNEIPPLASCSPEKNASDRQDESKQDSPNK